MKSKIISLLLPDIQGFTTFATDSRNGEVSLLMCRTINEVFVLDTQSKRVTSIIKVQSEIIKEAITHTFDGCLIICVSTGNKLRFFKYKAPRIA